MSTDAKIEQVNYPLPILVSSDHGQRIIEFLRTELQLPRLARRCTVTIEMNQCIVVECEYLPERKA
jgi:hypothetical protein